MNSHVLHVFLHEEFCLLRVKTIFGGVWSIWWFLCRRSTMYAINIHMCSKSLLAVSFQAWNKTAHIHSCCCLSKGQNMNLPLAFFSLMLWCSILTVHVYFFTSIHLKWVSLPLSCGSSILFVSRRVKSWISDQFAESPTTTTTRKKWQNTAMRLCINGTCGVGWICFALVRSLLEFRCINIGLKSMFSFFSLLGILCA